MLRLFRLLPILFQDSERVRSVMLIVSRSIKVG